ncbi:hypothetical protein GJ744_001890 [Endocarpon pusillum]|uniref:Uncharacterized protein n=1 Tax=Endocarpon pusillum TaxID=364733 RepID=A0A8H7E7N9_9EURO|nr:hypothetical protein GJ744_001890 [Endocarpon pusillum]
MDLRPTNPFHLNALLGAARYDLLPTPPHSKEELSFHRSKHFSAKKSEELQEGTRGCGCFTLGEPESRVRAPQGLSI